MHTVLITGANGFIGNYLTRLLADSYKVVATAKGDCRCSFNKASIVYEEMDITDPASVHTVFNKYHPHYVVHCAAISKPDECEQNKEDAYLVNVTATQYLLNCAAEYRSHFIFLSTDFIFDGIKGMYQEDEPAAPVNYYGQTKLLAEALVKNYAFKWNIVRTVLAYGAPMPGRDNIISIVVKSLKEGKTVKIFDDQVRTPTYVEDLTSGIKQIIDRGGEGIYHLSGKEVYTPYQMAIAAANYVGLDAELIQKATETTFSQPAKRPLKTGLNIKKAERELGYKTTSFEEGLRKTFVNWHS